MYIIHLHACIQCRLGQDHWELIYITFTSDICRDSSEDHGRPRGNKFSNYKIIKICITKKTIYVCIFRNFFSESFVHCYYSNQTLILTKNKKTLNKRINRSGYFFTTKLMGDGWIFTKKKYAKKTCKPLCGCNVVATWTWILYVPSIIIKPS